MRRNSRAPGEIRTPDLRFEELTGRCASFRSCAPLYSIQQLTLQPSSPLLYGLAWSLTVRGHSLVTPCDGMLLLGRAKLRQDTVRSLRCGGDLQYRCCCTFSFRLAAALPSLAARARCRSCAPGRDQDLGPEASDGRFRFRFPHAAGAHWSAPPSARAIAGASPCHSSLDAGPQIHPIRSRGPSAADAHAGCRGCRYGSRLHDRALRDEFAFREGAQQLDLLGEIELQRGA